MSTDEEAPPTRRFYNVDRLLQVLYRQRAQPPPGPLLRQVRRLALALDSVGGLFTAFTGIPIYFLGVAAVLVGIFYGPLAFLGAYGGSLALLTFYIQRKVGRSLQFGDYSVSRRALAQVLGFGLVLGLIYFLILLARLLNILFYS